MTGVTGARKAYDVGKMVCTFALGSRELYSYIDNNAQIEAHPSDYVNDPFVISRNDKVVAINSALSVDLTGQVCADSVGSHFYSGVGGQVDVRTFGADSATNRWPPASPKRLNA